VFFEIICVEYKALKHNRKVLSYANADVQVSLFNTQLYGSVHGFDQRIKVNDSNTLGNVKSNKE